MRQIAVLSGKGGTGKTTVTASLVRLLPAVIAVDADVDAPNLPLLLTATLQESWPFYGLDRVAVDTVRCTGCGACVPLCVFGALRMSASGGVEARGCEGCGGCLRGCPTQALSLRPHACGKLFLSRMETGWLVHADLDPGEDNSGKLVAAVRELAREKARIGSLSHILIDGPPGTSCPAIATLTGVDYVLAVVEESPSGLSDYQRLTGLLQRFRIPHGVLVNKAGINAGVGAELRQIVARSDGSLLGQIPFDEAIPRAQRQRQCLADMDAYRPQLAQVAQRLTRV